jgi:hypothetical protein
LRCDLQATGGENFEPADAAAGILNKKKIFVVLIQKKSKKHSRIAHISVVGLYIQNYWATQMKILHTIINK